MLSHRVNSIISGRNPPLYSTLTTHHRFLTRCIGSRNHNHRVDHPISYLDTLVKTGSESIEATLRRMRILFAGFVARMEDTRLPKCVTSGEMVGGAGCEDPRFSGHPLHSQHILHLLQVTVCS